MVRFGELPPAKRKNFDHEKIAAELRAHPEEWALVFEEVSAGMVRRIQLAELREYRPTGSFEARARNQRKLGGRQVFDVWARYVGEPES